jgi:hypothetical protein
LIPEKMLGNPATTQGVSVRVLQEEQRGWTNPGRNLGGKLVLKVPSLLIGY